MQTLRFASVPTVHSSFQRHRKSIDRSGFNLNLSLCTSVNAPIWASLPTPPMSGSPAPDPPKDPSQLAGRRRKRSDSPPSPPPHPAPQLPPSTTTASTGPLPTLYEHPTQPQRYGEQQPPTATRRLIEPTMQLAAQNIPFLPPLSYGALPSLPLTHYSPPELGSNPSQISPRSTRKTKAHVASACINCKKKHLRCDSSRPCRRCVQSGKEDTCKDVEHKKRGRPPLKPEDPSATARAVRGPGPTSLASFHPPSSTHPGGETPIFASNYPPILPSGPSSIFTHGRSSSRTSLYGGLQSPYAAPTVAPSTLTATATGFSYSTRPHSTSSSSISTQPPSPYVGHPGYLSQAPPRQSHAYTGYSYHPAELPPHTQALYPSPIFPREPMPQNIQGESQYRSGLQLPPIRPSQRSSVESIVSQQRSPMQPMQQQTQQQVQQQVQQQDRDRDRDRRRESGERDPKRPKMDIQGILGPKHD